MGLKLNHAGTQQAQANRADAAAANGFHDLDKQRLRILRCTAKAMASSPGGLRFKAGTRPWLEGVPGGRSERAVLQSATD